MVWTFILLTVTALFLLFVWQSRVLIEFNVSGGGQEGIILTVTFKLWGVFSHTKSISGTDSKGDHIAYTEKDVNSRHKEQIKKKKTSYTKLAERVDRIHSEWQHVKKFGVILSGFLRHVRVSSFKWETVIGTGDASSTAVMAGVLWSAKGVFINLLNTFLSVKKEPVIEVHPLFSHAYTKTQVSGMFSFKIGHAIVVMLRLIKARRKSRRRPNRSSNAMTGGIET